MQRAQAVLTDAGCLDGLIRFQPCVTTAVFRLQSMHRAGITEGDIVARWHTVPFSSQLLLTPPDRPYRPQQSNTLSIGCALRAFVACCARKHTLRNEHAFSRSALPLASCLNRSRSGRDLDFEHRQCFDAVHSAFLVVETTTVSNFAQMRLADWH